MNKCSSPSYFTLRRLFPQPTHIPRILLLLDDDLFLETKSKSKSKFILFFVFHFIQGHFPLKWMVHSSIKFKWAPICFLYPDKSIKYSLIPSTLFPWKCHRIGRPNSNLFSLITRGRWTLHFRIDHPFRGTTPHYFIHFFSAFCSFLKTCWRLFSHFQIIHSH